MGQYHYPVNLDKREFLHPHKLGCGLKIWEQLAGAYTLRALGVLLAVSNGRGGGDIQADDPDGMIGRWGGDRIAIVGDYAEAGDLAPEHRADTIYGRCDSDGEHIKGDEYADITESIRPILEQECGVKFEGSGWLDVVPKPGVEWSMARG